MADSSFLLSRYLSQGLTIGRVVEDRIVAETVATARRFQQESFPYAGRDLRQGIVSAFEVRDNADEATRTFTIGHGFNVGKKFPEVRIITRSDTCVARRINAGRAVQRVDREAGVIGNCGQPGMLRRMACLDDRVLDEGRAGLVHSERRDGEIAREHLSRGEYRPGK